MRNDEPKPTNIDKLKFAMLMLLSVVVGEFCIFKFVSFFDTIDDPVGIQMLYQQIEDDPCIEGFAKIDLSSGKAITNRRLREIHTECHPPEPKLSPLDEQRKLLGLDIVIKDKQNDI